ncbi:MAG: NAD(P)H-binding protein, partial [Myxococcota bacterium]
MAITIAAFGATGKTGKHFISQALDSGHALRVLVRDEAKLDPDHKRQMEVFVGDVTQADDVAWIIEGVDVVV